jgi:hypothetical protein
MKRKSFFIALLSLGMLWALQVPALDAQKTPKTLVLLYSNNFNGEIEPCPA